MVIFNNQRICSQLFGKSLDDFVFWMVILHSIIQGFITLGADQAKRSRCIQEELISCRVKAKAALLLIQINVNSSKF